MNKFNKDLSDPLYYHKTRSRAVKRKYKYRRRRLLILICAIALLATTITIITVCVSTNKKSPKPNEVENNTPLSFWAQVEDAKKTYLDNNTYPQATDVTPDVFKALELYKEIERLQEENATLNQQNTLLQEGLPQYSTGEKTAQYYDALPLSKELQQYTFDLCMDYDIAPYYEVVLALMWQESNFKADTISKTNDYGITQINKGNHAWLKEDLGITDFLDAKQGIEAGIYVLSGLYYRYEDIDKALMAYNLGPTGAKRRWDKGIFTSTYQEGVRAKETLVKANTYK